MLNEFMGSICGLASNGGSSCVGGDGWLPTDAGEPCARMLEVPGYDPESTLDKDGAPNSKSSSWPRFREVDLARWLNAMDYE